MTEAAQAQRTPPRIAYGTAILISLLVSSEFLRQSFTSEKGCVPCSTTGPSTILLLLGAVSWAGCAVALRRAPLPFHPPVLGALCGTHIALTARLVTTPDFCPLCVSTALLSCVPIAVYAFYRIRLRYGMLTLTVFTVATQMTLTLLGTAP